MYTKKIWVDRISEFPNRRILTDSNGSSDEVTVTRSEGEVLTEGDAFSAENMNDLEQRIDETFGTLSFGITEDGKAGYKIGGADTVIPFSSINEDVLLDGKHGTVNTALGGIFSVVSGNGFINLNTETMRYSDNDNIRHELALYYGVGTGNVYFASATPIDLTNYSKIIFKNFSYTYTSNPYTRIGVGTSRQSITKYINAPISTSGARYRVPDFDALEELVLDVSDLSGEYYIVMYSTAVDNYLRYIELVK